MSSPDSDVTLRTIDDGNVRDIIGLSVSSHQESFVAPNAVSMAEAFATTKVWVRAIYADDTPVGFAMLSDDDESHRYYLWRFMIDSKYQRMGFGKLAMGLIHDYVSGRPEGDKVYLCYVHARGGPEHFYKSLGYVDTGQDHGGEIEAVLDLNRRDMRTW